MIGRFLYGAGVGGVMATIGLAAASLVTEPQPTSRLAEATTADTISPVEARPETVVPKVLPDAAEADPPAKVEPAAEMPLPKMEASEIPSKSEAAPAGAGAVKALPSVALTATAEKVPAPPPALEETTRVAEDVLAALTAKATQPAAETEAAPAAADPLALVPKPTVSLEVNLPATTAEPDATPPPLVSEVAAPLVFDQPGQPPLPAEDGGVATMQPPDKASIQQDDTLIAAADPPDAPQVPVIADPSPPPQILEETSVEPPFSDDLPKQDPAADAGLEPALKPLPEIPPPVVPSPGMAPSPETDATGLPGTEAPMMPGTKSGTLPRTKAATPAPEASPAVETDPAIRPGLVEADSPTLKPTPGLGLQTEGVIIGRLPKIGGAPSSDSMTDAIMTADSPLVTNARTFDNPERKPLLAVILIDTGDAALDREALARLPFAVSFAIDPLDPAAARHAAIYRAAGQEVVMLATGIAKGAQASDIEVAFQAMAQGLPEAVAVMEVPSLGFQDNRPLASLVVPVVSAQGRGLLTWDKGLNAADQIARRENLAAAVIFRNLDSAGEEKTAIRRALDRAVFKAAQDGRVSVVGQTLPDTIAALLEWNIEGRAATVAIAPVSAVVSVQ